MKNIVIVDDSVFITTQIQYHLKSLGYNIIAVGINGAQGVELYKIHKPDLIILDITMPIKNGLECLSEIIDYDTNAKAFMVTALADKSTLLKCIKIGAKGFVQKPLLFKDKEFCEMFNGKISKIFETKYKQVS